MGKRNRFYTEPMQTVLEFQNSLGVYEPNRNRVVVPARQATQAGGIDFWAL
jgi:hypothetical protein